MKITKVYDPYGKEKLTFAVSYSEFEKFKEWTKLGHDESKRIWSSAEIESDPVFGKAKTFNARIVEE